MLDHSTASSLGNLAWFSHVLPGPWALFLMAGGLSLWLATNRSRWEYFYSAWHSLQREWRAKVHRFLTKQGSVTGLWQEGCSGEGDTSGYLLVKSWVRHFFTVEGNLFPLG